MTALHPEVEAATLAAVAETTAQTVTTEVGTAVMEVDAPQTTTAISCHMPATVPVPKASDRGEGGAEAPEPPSPPFSADPSQDMAQGVAWQGLHFQVHLNHSSNRATTTTKTDSMRTRVR